MFLNIFLLGHFKMTEKRLCNGYSNVIREEPIKGQKKNETTIRSYSGINGQNKTRK